LALLEGEVVDHGQDAFGERGYPSAQLVVTGQILTLGSEFFALLA